MTKNEEDVLKRIDLAPEVRRFLAKGEYKAKNYYYRPGGQLPLSARDRIKRSLTTGSSSLSKDGQTTLGKVKNYVGLVGVIGTIGVAKFHPTAALATALVAGGATSVSQIIDGVIQRDDKSQAEVAAMNKVLEVSHERARVRYTDIPIEGLKKIEQIIESMITRQADWINDVEDEREYEKKYEVMQLVVQRESKLSYPNNEILNMAKAMRQPNYELLNSAKGLSIEKMEEGLITLAGSQLAARCRRVELEGSHKARPDGIYTGWVYDVDKKIINQVVQCGFSGKEFTIIKYPRDAILNIKELEENKTYTIYCGPNGKATAERIDDLSLENDNNSSIVELRGR